MTSQKSIGSAVCKNFLSAYHNFRFGAAHISYESVGRQMRHQSLDKIDDRTHGCGQHHHVTTLTGFDWIGDSVVNCFNFLRQP